MTEADCPTNPQSISFYAKKGSRFAQDPREYNMGTARSQRANAADARRRRRPSAAVELTALGLRSAPGMFPSTGCSRRCASDPAPPSNRLRWVSAARQACRPAPAVHAGALPSESICIAARATTLTPLTMQDIIYIE